MKKNMKNISILFLVFVLLAFTCLPVQAAVSSKSTGTYKKVWKSSFTRNGISPTYCVIINKITKTKVVMQVERFGVNGSPIYLTDKITAKRSGNSATFKWKDSWNNSGTGKIVFSGNCVKIKMNQTKTAKGNRGTLDTGGQYYKLKKSSNNKKIIIL